MNLTNAPSKIVLPFANGGAKNTIPVASQIGVTDGAASWTDGFPPLTRVKKALGGKPPAALDMNGVLNATSAICRWTVTGAGYTYDSTFAADANIGGYPKAARVARTDGAGYWINTTDGNTTDPEAGGAGWYPDFTAGATSITMTSSNVTLTPLQYGKQVIIITGTLSANVNLIFPALVAKWTVINNTTGNYTITCKTASGSGVVVAGVQAIVGDGTNIVGQTFASSKSQNGWQKLPSGLIVQWGYQSLTNATFSFPISFPSACLNIMASNANSQGSNSDTAYAYPTSSSQFFIATKGSSGNIGGFACYWLAIGN